MTKLLVVLIALVLAWIWVSRMVRGVLGSPRAAEARSFLRLLQVLQRAAGNQRAGGAGAGAAGTGRSRSAPAGPDRAGALVRCRRCGVHVPEPHLTAGVCGDCLKEEDRTA